MREVSKMDWDMVRENGHLGKQNIQVIIRKDSNKVLDNCISQAAIFIKVILLKTRDKVMGKCFGLMAHSTREIGKEVFRMERGRYIWLEERSSVVSFKIVF